MIVNMNSNSSPPSAIAASSLSSSSSLTTSPSYQILQQVSTNVGHNQQPQILIATSEDKFNSQVSSSSHHLPIRAIMMMAPVTATTAVTGDSLTLSQQHQPDQQQFNLSIVQQQQPPQQSIDDDVDQFIDHDAELSTLEGAAFQSRLWADKMSAEEMKAFHDVVENTSLIPLFLHIRNSILKFWLINPKVREKFGLRIISLIHFFFCQKNSNNYYWKLFINVLNNHLILIRFLYHEFSIFSNVMVILISVYFKYPNRWCWLNRKKSE